MRFGCASFYRDFSDLLFDVGEMVDREIYYN